MERVAIFIDGSHFYHSLKRDFNKASVDFEKLCTALVGDRQLVRAYYYNAPLDQTREPERYREQQRFLHHLEDTPYLTVRLGRLETRRGTTVEKGVDVAIAVDMLRLAMKDVYDTAILVSGDGDFAYAVEAAKDFGKHVENACTRSGQSRHLKRACDRFVLLDGELLSGCWLNQ